MLGSVEDCGMQTTRGEAWKKLVWRRSVIAIGIATLFLSTSTYWWDELYPTLTRPRLAVFIHAIPWWYWVIAGLVVILVLVVEESLKTINRSEAELEEYKTKAAHRPNIAIVIHSISVARPTSDIRRWHTS